MEYSLSLEPEKEKEINNYIEDLNSMTRVKKMNRVLYRCKDIVLSLGFYENDPNHKFMKSALEKFGVPM